MMFKDKYIHKLYAFALAAVFALTLAGCGGGGGGSAAAPDPGTTPAPDPAIAERAAISGAIDAAEAAVGMVNDTASDATVAAADAAIAAANAAIANAANVPDAEKAANSGTVSVLETALSMAKTSRTAAMGAADAAMKAAMAATGKALSAALGPDDAGTTALTNIATFALAASGLTIDASAGAGAIADGTDPASVELKAGDAAGSLGGWSGMDFALSSGTGAARITNEARVYTNRGPDGSEDFGDRHILTDGSLEVTAANVGLVRADAFTHSGTQTHQVPDRNDAVYVRGTYDGAPGEYSCSATCSSTNNGSGAPSALGGTWTFTPDKGAQLPQPDDTYLYFGWWVSKDNDGKPTAASAFAGVVEPTATPLATGGDLSTLTGSATYVGHAAGKFAMSNTLDGTGNGGHFTADAELTATFSGTNPGVTGTIDNFRLNDGSEDPGWSVSLARGGLGASDGSITAPAADATVWSINGNKAPASGTWSGTMYDEMPGDPPGGDGSNLPTTVTGTFYSEFSTIGRMVGAFGANKE